MKLQFIFFGLCLLTIVPALARHNQPRPSNPPRAQRYPNRPRSHYPQRPAQSRYGSPYYEQSRYGSPDYGDSNGSPDYGGSNGPTIYDDSNGPPHYEQSRYGSQDYDTSRYGSRDYVQSRYGLPDYGGSNGSPDYGGSNGSPDYDDSNGPTYKDGSLYGPTHYNETLYGPHYDESRYGRHMEHTRKNIHDGYIYGSATYVSDVTGHLNDDILVGGYTRYVLISNDQYISIEPPSMISLRNLLARIGGKIETIRHRRVVNFEIVTFDNMEHINEAIHSYPHILPKHHKHTGTLTADNGRYMPTGLDIPPVTVYTASSHGDPDYWWHPNPISTIYLFLSTEDSEPRVELPVEELPVEELPVEELPVEPVIHMLQPGVN